MRIFSKNITYKNIRNTIDNTLTQLEIVFFRVIANLLLSKRKIWLVGERTDTAQENGYFLYKYLKEIEPNEESYYIIEKNCTQQKHIEKFGNIIYLYSFKHKLFFSGCKYYVNTHDNSCFPRSYFGNKRFKPSTKMLNVFLPHGITSADVSEFYGKENSNINLFTCGAKPEYDYIKDTFGYRPDEVVYTGFARFDDYYNAAPKRQILLTPTWRRDIWTNCNADVNKDDYFKTTEYYLKFQSLINNTQLYELLNKFNYSLVFYPHYEILPYVKHFSTESKSISVGSLNGETLQNLLKSSSLLITDTSGVSFDFAYMYKPMIYYLFDHDKIINSHIKKGYFDYNTMGFGEVVKNEDELIVVIEKYLNNDCNLSNEYKSKIDVFFPLHDKKNCERIYWAIKNKEKYEL